MKNILYKFAIICLLLIISGIIAYTFSNNSPHKFKQGQCGFCHINYEFPFHFMDNITTLCNYCHGKRNAISHIVGIKPSMKVPEGFHLDDNGEITCATCHNIHMDLIDPGTGKRTYLLRGNLRGRRLCDSCHGNTSETIKVAKSPPTHAEILETAHFGYYTTETYFIDRVSIICIGCHEGSTSTLAPYSLKTGHAVGGSHPIGITYTRASRKNKDIRSPKSLKPEIKLFGGKVGCTSCHNPFTLSQHKLSLDNEESKLCLECHLK